jgi:hypothetical protein
MPERRFSAAMNNASISLVSKSSSSESIFFEIKLGSRKIPVRY